MRASLSNFDKNKSRHQGGRSTTNGTINTEIKIDLYFLDPYTYKNIYVLSYVNILGGRGKGRE